MEEENESDKTILSVEYPPIYAPAVNNGMALAIV